MLFLTAVIYLLSNLDDLFIDIVYWARFAWLKISDNPRARMHERKLRTGKERPLAVMIPAWQESGVIAQMVTNTQRFAEYEDYTLFIGVYRNDPETEKVVDLLVKKYDNIVKTVVPHDGPTCKADCLNWIIHSIFAHEKNTGREFRMVVMHDSEDVIHPLEFRLFNHLIDKHDFIQIPVRPLEREWYQFVSGTYMDEFAEFHAKDMIVRNFLCGIVPSAGVSTCFSREALEKLGEQNQGEIFNTSSLTEDYEIGYRVSALNFQQKFSKYWLDIALTPKNKYRRKGIKRIPLAVGEYFPKTLWTAIRQKTRWNIGIFFQSAGRLTWQGSFFTKYFFIRDRKGILTNILILPAYFLSFLVIFFWILGDLQLVTAFELTLPSWLIWANFLLFSQRMMERFLFTRYSYGWREGFLSLPRVMVSNLINMSSTVRSLFIYGKSLIFKEKIAWDKTTHFYPSPDTLDFEENSELGEYLIKRNILTPNKYARLLHHRDMSRKALGDILIEEGLLTRRQLLSYISDLTDYPIADTTSANLKTAAELLPPSLLQKHNIFPLNRDENNCLTIATAKRVSPSVLQEILDQGYSDVIPCIILKEDLHDLLDSL